jgi:IclR family acetate operon transcriptional repressor
MRARTAAADWRSIVSLRETEIGKAPGTAAADRVAGVLMAFVGAGSVMGVSEISRSLGLSKAVVYRILRSLESRELLVFEEPGRGYRLGPAAAALGAWALRNLDLRKVASPVLRRLQGETGETATVSELLGASRVYLDQVPSPQEIRMTVELGRPFPLHAGASSRVILAFAPPDLKEATLAGPLEALTSLTPTDRARLEDELSGIVESGTAASLGERQPGAGSVAAPVFGIDGYAIGALSVCGPVSRFDEETVEGIRPLVREAGLEVSRNMGWNGEAGEIAR